MRAFDERYRFEDDRVVIKREADLGDHLEACRDLRAETPEHGKFRGDHVMYRVASIPAIVAMQWRNEGIDIFDTSPEMQKRIRAKLNLDAPALKTVNARL